MWLFVLEMNFQLAGANATQPKNKPPSMNASPTQRNDVKPKSPKPSSDQN